MNELIMMHLRWSICSIFLFTLILTTVPDTVQGSSNNNILLNDLKHFNMNRHHVTNPRGKELARGYIQKKFTYFGLHTWTEEFKTSQITTTGVNIVGVLPGRLYKTSNDRLILIGAHYDTLRNTNGVDDNGSGVVAMLQVARLLTKTPSRCTREYSVMFVAFDFEEWEENTISGCACAKLGCGSRAFVSNFSQYYDLRKDMSIARYGQLQGAIIMDTMMNYNSAPNSQTVPSKLKTIFPEQYKSIIRNQKRGDFLLATGRHTDDMPMLNTFDYNYRKGREQGNKYKLQVFPLPFDGPASNLPEEQKHLMASFLRSDHVSFWNEITSNRAICLSDTANMRSYMRTCYHENCDNLSHVTNDFLGFLSQSCDTIVMTTKYLTITNTNCGASLQSEGVSAVGGGAIGTAITVFLGVNAVVLWACCRRRKQDDENVLVDDEQLESGRTDVLSEKAETGENQPSKA